MFGVFRIIEGSAGGRGNIAEIPFEGNVVIDRRSVRKGAVEVRLHRITGDKAGGQLFRTLRFEHDFDRVVEIGRFGNIIDKLHLRFQTISLQRRAARAVFGGVIIAFFARDAHKIGARQNEQSAFGFGSLVKIHFLIQDARVARCFLRPHGRRGEKKQHRRRGEKGK